LTETGWQKSIELKLRIPALALPLCFPVAFVLSMLTPQAIRLGVPDISRSGRVAGLIFSLSTLGCLLGNYLTGFVLVPHFTINVIVMTVAALFFFSAAGVLLLFRHAPDTEPINPAKPASSIEAADERTPAPVLPMPFAYTIVFLCSFAGMTLELASTRLLAQLVGVSLYTWTGVIGVMLAGTAFGNWWGGRIADRAQASWQTRTMRLAACMIGAGLFTVGSIVLFSVFTQGERPFQSLGLIGQILALTFSMFFLPMFLLGTVSPQVIRLAIPDVSVAGRVAGRVYAFSTLGAIVGTFAAGYFLISAMGVYLTVLLCAVFPILGVFLIQGAFKNSLLLYATSAAMGGVVGGLLIKVKYDNAAVDAKLYTLETNYYTIRVITQKRTIIEPIAKEWEPVGALVGFGAVAGQKEFSAMVLDHLTHSSVDLDDPTYLYYKHEQIQVELMREAAANHPEEQNVLVIGGGGYTFPRCVRTTIPTSVVDVVEIDPGVTKVAYDRLALDPKLGIHSFHMDGRQYVAEIAKPNHYHLVTLDAVNDLSVPAHLMTKEFNESIKKTLTPDGVYLATVIDDVGKGKLWRAAVHTLMQSFEHVEVVFPLAEIDPDDLFKTPRKVIVIYASNRPLDFKKLNGIVEKQTGVKSMIYVVPKPTLDELLAVHKKLILTDQYAPVDNLMADVFRDR